MYLFMWPTHGRGEEAALPRWIGTHLLGRLKLLALGFGGFCELLVTPAGDKH